MTTQPSSAVEPENPIVDEIAQLDAKGEGTDIPQETEPSAEIVAGKAEAPIEAKLEQPEAEPETPPQQPQIPAELRAYITQLEQQRQVAQQQADAQVLEQTTKGFAAQLEEQQGLTPEQAQFVANHVGQLLYRQYQAEMVRRRQIADAFAISKEHGVDASELINLPNADAMRQTAALRKNALKRDEEVAALRAEVAALKKATVPAQSFESGATMAAVGNPSGDDLEGAWLKFEVEHPNRPNPYEAKYRAMLSQVGM